MNTRSRSPRRPSPPRFSAPAPDAGPINYNIQQGLPVPAQSTASVPSQAANPDVEANLTGEMQCHPVYSDGMHYAAAKYNNAGFSSHGQWSADQYIQHTQALQMSEYQMMFNPMFMGGMANPATMSMASSTAPLKANKDFSDECRRKRHKSRLCVYFKRHGQCHLAGNCTFAHSESELPPTWRTTLCRNWQMNGTCLRSDTCGFAHGEDELRPYVKHM